MFWLGGSAALLMIPSRSHATVKLFPKVPGRRVTTNLRSAPIMSAVLLSRVMTARPGVGSELDLDCPDLASDPDDEIDLTT